MEYLKDIGLRIVKLRKSLGITQDALSQMVGYTSRSSINKIEKGLVDIPLSKIIGIADALHTTPAYLMGWEDQNKINSPKPLTSPITEEEVTVVEAYRAQPEVQTAVKRVLGLEDGSMYIAAQTKPNNKYVKQKINKADPEQSAKLHNAPEDSTDIM